MAITELTFNEDNTITFGDTDGPLPIEARGSWQLNDDEFQMEICRTFETGVEGSAESNLNNRIGQFAYDVLVGFRGELISVGGKLAVEGSMVVSKEDLGDLEVGYFSLLDTTAVDEE